MLGEQGRHEEALKISEESVSVHERLADRNRDKYEADFALSLKSLGERFAALHQLVSAQPASAYP
jgi:hypothetical protein